VLPGALHATFYNSLSEPMGTALHVPFSTTIPGAHQVRYRGFLKLPYTGNWSIQFIGCNFSLGAARFDGIPFAAAIASGGNSVINVAIIDHSKLYDFVFHCSNFSVPNSSMKFNDIQFNSSSAFSPRIYAGFHVLLNSFVGQGLWATYYNSSLVPTSSVSNQGPTLMVYSMPKAYSIRWTGFIQVNSTRSFSFAVRFGGQNTASLTINDQKSSSLIDYDGSGRMVTLAFMTIFLYSGELYNIDIDMKPGTVDVTCDQNGLLWSEYDQPQASIYSHLVPFPAENLFSTLSRSTVAANDTLQFSWRLPLNKRVIRGSAMARGMGQNRQNSHFLVSVNSGAMCAATSSFLSSTFVTLFTAGVASSFLFFSRDEFANFVERIPSMSFWGIQSSLGEITRGSISSITLESTTTFTITPPSADGLVGYYTANSFNVVTKVWNDLSGQCNHATETSGTFSVTQEPGASPYIQGGTSSWIKFPSAVLPSTYTLFYVARYNGAAKGRIFNGMSSNWLSGFHGGRAGVAHHNCWITPQTDLHGSNWIMASDRMNSFRSNGVERKNSNSCVSSNRLSINTAEQSDFAVQIVLVYNRRLEDSEVNLVENWLNLKSWNSQSSSTNSIGDQSSSLSNASLRVSFLPTLSG
jgi:hypothetical protein